jgi:hypothetical protein
VTQQARNLMLDQNLRRSHYELAVDAPGAQRVEVAFAELARAI